MENRLLFDVPYYCEVGSHAGLFGIPFMGVLYMTQEEYAMYQQNGITISVTKSEPEEAQWIVKRKRTL